MGTRFQLRPHCAVCGNQNARTLLSRDFTHPSVWQFIDGYYEHRVPKEWLDGSQFEVKDCPRCGFMWQGQVLANEGLALLYENWISYEASLRKKDEADIALFAKYAYEVYAIHSLFGVRPCEVTVLDHGMGWGYWCLMAKSFGFRVSGLEMSPRRVEYARQQSLQVIGAEDLAQSRFDFINSEQVFEHIPNPLDELNRLKASLSPRGIIRISVPNGLLQKGRLDHPDWKAGHDAFHPLEHVNAFTPASLRRMAEEAGLTEIESPPQFSFHPSLREMLFSRFFPAAARQRRVSKTRNQTRVLLRKVEQ